MKQFYFKSIFLSLLMMVTGMNVASAQSEVTLWQEDFSAYSKDAVPSGGTYSYVCEGSNTKIYEEAFAGGESPELLLQKSNNGTLTAVIPLDNIEGYLTLTFKTNNQKIKVNSTTAGITGGVEEKKEGDHTTTFSGVTTSMKSITIVFTCTGSSNVRLDNIVLKGTKSASAPTGIAINETNFPDNAFRTWVSENCDKADDNGDKDGYLSDEEIAAQNAWIILSNKNIEDLKGIEYFTAVKSLMCDNNKLTSLDVSKNTALGLLHCTDNQLTSLDVSKNTELTMLLCQNNQLTSLDVSNNQKLTTLDCSNNLINETEMGKLVASMPTVSGDGVFYPFNLSVEDANVITTTQVDEAKGKNWNVQAYNGEGIGYVDYDGVEPTPETNEYYEKVTTAPSDWSGDYLIVYEEGSVAFNGGLSTLDAEGNTIEVVMDDNKIDATEETDAAAFTIAKNADGAYTIKSASGKYIGVSSNSNGLKQTDNASTYTHNLSIDDNKNAVIKAAFSGSNMSLRYNYANNQLRFRYYSSGQQPIQLYKKVTTTTNQYKLVAGDQEYSFEGLTLTKELPAQTEFYIKDSNGNEYHSTDAQTKLTIIAENHENLPTSADGKDFYLKKENTWVFTLTEGEGGAVTLTVNPQTAGETKYMLASEYHHESNDVFDANNQLTKEMTTEGFYITRSDDYGITNLTAAESNVSGYYIWEFSDDAEKVGYIPDKIINVYRVSMAGSYTFTLDLENKTLKAELVSENQYKLVAGDQEYSFEGLTLTQALPEHTQFYVKDSNGNVFHSTDTQTQLIINAENHENLPTSAEGNDFYLSKANTWVFTLTEGEGGAVTLTVNPETPGETKYMLSADYLTESEIFFDENFKVSKEFTAGETFFITRSDDYGLVNLTAAEHNVQEGGVATYVWDFSEDAPTVAFTPGRINTFRIKDAGIYTVALDFTNNTITVTDEVTATGNLNNSDTGVFAGEETLSGSGNKNKGKTATGKLTTAVGNVTIVYGVDNVNGNAYLDDTHIRMYKDGTTLKFTAPRGYSLTKIKFNFKSGNTSNLSADKEAYSSGTWEGEEKEVTFTSSTATIHLWSAEVTLEEAAPSAQLESIAVEGQKTEFLVGSTFEFGGRVTATYDDESTKDIPEENVTFSGYDMSTAGDQTVTVSYTEDEVTKTVDYTITVKEPETIKFMKITSTDELVPGKRYVLVNEEAKKVIAQYYNKYFEVKGATISDERVTLLETEANILTLGGEEGAWTFATSIEAGKYLYFNTPTSGSSGSNYLELGADDTALGAQWTISFDEDGNAIIQTNYNKESVDDNHPDRYIRFNSNPNQLRFACYKSTESSPYGTQQPVQLYVESDLEDVTLTITDAGYATLYYSDRALKVPKDVTAKTYKVVDGKLAESKKYVAGSKIPAGEAVVLKGAPGEYTFKVTSTPEPKDADNQLKGSDEAALTEGGNFYYALQAKSKDGKHGPGFYWMNSTGEYFTNGAHKAYMALDEKFAEAQAVGGAKEFYLFDEATTGISGIDAASADRTEIYNLNGQRVDRGYKGVVIKNGKKIVIK